ncbi:MAG: hypothetical protein H0V37_04445 [Chloroflexia bacterium]|nr:hypothetical protein [Chloroflexia bacterium]
MTERPFAPWTRRRLLQNAGALTVASTVAHSLAATGPALSAPASTISVSTSPAFTLAQSAPLADAVGAVCARLAPGGWRGLLLRVTGNELDIEAADLPAMLAQPLATIDRTVPGFEDFALEGTRGIEPGSPARSLLYHALASPNVFQDADGAVLSLFPTPAELEAVENYVYAAAQPSLDDIRGRAGGDPLGVVVFALEYRPGRETVHQKHADLCFSRTGHARLGTAAARYDAQRREFLPVLGDDPYAFPVQPARYAAYLAVQRRADPASFGPLRATDDDQDRLFWVPLHKLFDGPESIQGLDLTVELTVGHVNEKLRRFHQQLNSGGFSTGWNEPDIEQFPFVITGDVLAPFSDEPGYGTGWVMPQAHPLVEPAVYQGKPLTFFYSKELAANAASLYFSGLQVLEAPPYDPLGPERTQYLPENMPGQNQTAPNYLTGIGPDVGRSAPEYLNVRRRVGSDGTEENLNDLPDVLELVQEGGYWARHFIDYSADGWVSARCVALDTEVSRRVAAYSMISPPSFYPYTNQRELTEWAETGVPEGLREGLWAIPPRPLSDRRLAANIHLPAGFDIDDVTVTALVSHPSTVGAGQSGEPATFVRRHLLLPDGAAGLFDPGWDVSQDRTEDNRFFLESYGLGTPFVEDVKLCASLSTYWPGVSPDSSREFQPDKEAVGTVQAWPTIAPMTDAEIGAAATAEGDYLPWDGIQGPVAATVDGRSFADYPDIFHADYLETFTAFTASLTGAVDHEEYTARVLAMAQVYWSLGIRYADYGDRYDLGEALDRFQGAKSAWAVLSFRAVTERDEELTTAEASSGVDLSLDRLYRFHLFTWGGEDRHPEDVRRILVAMEEQVVAYTDLTNVLVGRADGAWEYHEPPTR